jgi:hypothetical protein
MTTLPRKSLLPCAAALLAMALVACDAQETGEATASQPDRTTPQPPPSSSSPADGVTLDATVTIEGVTVGIPDRWMPATGGSQFTAVQYTIPGRDPSLNATLTVSNPIGGGLMYNTLRWERQFRGEEANTKSWLTVSDGTQIMQFEGRGPFDTGLPGSTGVQDNMAVLGAVPIVNGSEQLDLGDPDDDGRYTFTIDQGAQPLRLSNIFIKLTGPAETVDAAREEWDAMLESIRLGDVSEWAAP